MILHAIHSPEVETSSYHKHCCFSAIKSLTSQKRTNFSGALAMLPAVAFASSETRAHERVKKKLFHQNHHIVRLRCLLA